MKRNKWVLFVLLCSIPAFAQNLLTNGDFEAGSAGWTQWWGGNSALPANDPIGGDNCAGVWWSDDGIYQGIPIGPDIYTVSVEMINTSDPDWPLGQNRIGVIQAEVGDGINTWWIQQVVIDQTSALDTWISGSTVVDNTTAGATYLNINLFLIDMDGQGTGAGNVRYDNISVTTDVPLNSPNYNGDNTVNLLDFVEFSGVWNQQSDSHNLIGNAYIGIEDLQVFISAWMTIIPGYSGYELLWSDEFYGTSLNPADWEYMTGDGCSYGLCGWGNDELQYYRPENLTVQDGKLIIEAKQENYGGKQFTSGRIRTYNKHDFLYGRMEAKIKVPTGGGMWPAFWMMPTDSVYGDWAASGEIDIMETCNDTDYIGGTLHFGGEWPSNAFSGGTYSPGGIDFSEDFHVYTLEWEPDVMRWYVDGILYSTKTSNQWYSNAAPGNNRAPFDQEFHFLLNIAVGGNYPGCTSPGCITASFPQQMIIDWIRVYEKTVP